MKNRNIRDVIGGTALIVIGVFAAVYAQPYEIGQLQNMGPGYFPTVLGILLAILGVCVATPAFFCVGASIKVEWKSLFWVILSILTFALLLNTIGLVGTVASTVLVSSMASNLSWLHRSILSVCISAISYAIFVFGLGMLIPTWPWS